MNPDLICCHRRGFTLQCSEDMFVERQSSLKDILDKGLSKKETSEIIEKLLETYKENIEFLNSGKNIYFEGDDKVAQINYYEEKTKRMLKIKSEI